MVKVLDSILNNSFFSQDTVICRDLGPGLLNALSPTKGDGTYTYSWQSRSAHGNWTSIPSSNVKRYDPGILTDTTLYRRIVYSGNGQACKDTSPAKTIKVLPLISNNLTSTLDNRDCAGELPKPITGSQPAGGNLTYSYQWLKRTSGNWRPIPLATYINLSPDSVVATTTQYGRIVFSGKYNACIDTSAALVIDVVPYIQNNITLADQTICENDTPLALNGTPATGGLGGFTYQWIERKDVSSAWSPATGLNSAVSYTPGPLTDTTLYSRIATSEICPDTSGSITVTVYPSLTNNNIPGGAIQYACYNTSHSLTGSQPARGSGSYSYEWQKSSNNTDWTPADGSDKNFNTPALTSPFYFRRVVYSSPVIHECADTSSSIEVRINPLPTGDLVGSINTICEGKTLTVKFLINGDHPPFSVTIGGKSQNGYTTSPGSMDFTPVFTKPFTMDSITYTMDSIVDDSGCVSDNSLFTEEAKVIVNEMPVANAGSDDEVCSDTFTLNASGSIPGSTGTWSSNGATFTDPSDPHTVTTVGQYGTKLFTWTEYNWICHTEDQVQVIFNEQPTVADAGPDQELDFSYTTQLEAATPLVGSGKWTVASGAGEFNNDTLPDAVIVELDNSTTLMWTVHNGSCTDISDQVNILIKPLIITKGFSPNGDTKNDVFDLGAVNAERIRLKIYNTAGVLVFESPDYTEGRQWDGKNTNGVELPEGTYFYIADIKVAGREKEFQFRSFVEILR
jgi:gliding motility-associated-like protein